MPLKVVMANFVFIDAFEVINTYIFFFLGKHTHTYNNFVSIFPFILMAFVKKFKKNLLISTKVTKQYYYEFKLRL